MVSFSCEACNDTVIKKKLEQHRQRCPGAYFTCIDCSTTFNGTDYRQHTSCISEAEKYEKGMYKGKKTKKEQDLRKQEPAKGKGNAASQLKSSLDEGDKVSNKKAGSTKEKSLQKSKPKKLADVLKINKKQNLYKVIKGLLEASDGNKKDVLKRLQVIKHEDGSIRIL